MVGDTAGGGSFRCVRRRKHASTMGFAKVHLIRDHPCPQSSLFRLFRRGFVGDPEPGPEIPDHALQPSASGIFGSQFSSSFALEMSGFLLPGSSAVFSLNTVVASGLTTF